MATASHVQAWELWGGGVYMETCDQLEGAGHLYLAHRQTPRAQLCPASSLVPPSARRGWGNKWVQIIVAPLSMEANRPEPSAKYTCLMFSVLEAKELGLCSHLG